MENKIISLLERLIEKLETMNYTHHIDSIARDFNAHNGSGHQIINNFVSHLKVAPKSIRLEALRSNGYVAVVAFVLMILIVVPLEALVYEYDYYMLGMGLMASVLMPIIVTIAEKIMLKYSWGHVIYEDSVLTYDGRQIKFYDEIWDMKLSDYFWNKRKITFYAVNPENSKIYYKTIKFLYHTEAKYVYDTFWSGKIET